MKPNPVVISYLPQRLVAASAIELRREVRDALHVGIKAFLLDFQEVEVIDDDGLAVLGMILEDVQAAEGLLFLCSLTKHSQLALELAGLNQGFTIFANQSEFHEKVLGE